MPGSSKIVTSTPVKVEEGGSDRDVTSISARGCEGNLRNTDGIQSSKDNMSPSLEESREADDANCTTSFKRSNSNNDTSDVKREHDEVPLRSSADGEGGQNMSMSTSKETTSKMAPTCPSPPRNAESSETHLFSPQSSSAKLSNDRVDFDQLDLEDSIMSETPFHFDEVPPQGDLTRSSPGVETGKDSASKMVSKKRRSPRPDYSYPTKRSHVAYSHHSHYPNAQEDSLGSTPSSSKIRYPAYYNYYPYPPPTYQGEHRTPNRHSHQQGGYYTGYSPYPSIYSERSQRDSRSFPLSAVPHAPYDSDEESPPSPPSPGARLPSTTATASTPEKVLDSINAKSPFRSPVRDPSWIGSESKNAIGFRPSPFFQRSPGISGSFDMGTPNGTLMVDDDNLGPIFHAFEASTPCTLRSFDGATLMSIGRSPSNPDDTLSPTAIGRDKQRQRSPLTQHMNDLSSIDNTMLHGNTRSPQIELDHQNPLVGFYHPEGPNDSFDATSSAGGRKYPKASAVTMSGRRDGMPSSRLDPGAEPKQLWPSEPTPKERPSGKAGTPGKVRLEIGGTGSLTTRKSLEGINIMMQPRSSTNQNKNSAERKTSVSGYATTPSGLQTSAQHQRPPHHSYVMGDITTPRKAYSHIRTGHGRHQYPYPPVVGPGRKHAYPQKSESHFSMGGAHKPMYMSYPLSREGNAAAQHHPNIPTSDGKENNKKKGPPKRSPCNCKKSRCLKLYCECFAAERFCQGCNCVDCGNTPEAGEIREKAIKDTRAKNSKAFQNRFSVENSQGGKSTQKVHNMGCKCKKSACLKKYCECFNAGALCGTKCKCIDCLNYAGSQALIDKRRKIKDRSGAEYALRVSDEQWKSGIASSGRKAPVPSHRRHPIPSPVIMPSHHSMYPSPRGHPPQGSHGYSRLPSQRQYYMGPPTQMVAHGHPHAGYAPMGMPVTPGYRRPPHRMSSGEGLPHSMYRPPHSNRLPSAGRPVAKSTKNNHKSTTGSPKTPGIRKPFDLATSRKKRNKTDGVSEPLEPYFGEERKQPKTTALAVFSFLSNDDLYHASLVCRRWGELAFDEELWKF